MEKEYELSVEMRGYPAPSGYGMGSLIAEMTVTGQTEELTGMLYDEVVKLVDAFCIKHKIPDAEE